MSKERTIHCQNILTLFRQPLEEFYRTVNSHGGREHGHLSLQLSRQQLALVVASYPSAYRKAVFLPSPAESKMFLKAIKSWDTFLEQGRSWHLLDDSLTEQERSGITLTSLSEAMSAWLTEDPTHHFIIPASAADLTVPFSERYRDHILQVTVGEKIESIRYFSEQLVARGYTRHTTSLEPGSFRIQGEQIYVSLPYSSGYFVLTLYGSHLESIVHTDHHRTYSQTSLHIIPVNFPSEQEPLLDHLKSSLVFKPVSLSGVQGNTTITYDSLHNDVPFPFNSVTERSLDKKNNYYVLYKNEHHIRHFLSDQGITPQALCAHALADIPVSLQHKNDVIVSEKFFFPSEPSEEKGIGYRKGLELISSLIPGKPAVHADHGIGIFEGLQERTLGTYTRDYIILRYADGDVLSVPVEFAHKVTAYVGETPTLHRLGGVASWLKVRKKAQEDAVKLAKEMLRLARTRSTQTREPYFLNPEIDATLDRTFPFSLTPDQQVTWQDIRRDLESTIPVDRLVVGDVGFGKTEIALRAAAHVVANGKQVAVIAPTTLLVQQHADTFIERLKESKNNIGVLSRFITHRDHKKVVAGIADGSITIAIGTHALLSKHLSWKHLGLVIIDEEQRFGVKQKEHFKALRAQVDMLSMSATPIPRTLSMALSGLRQLSVIATPPRGRQEVKTIVTKDTNTILKNAISFELQRQGQVYVVSPRVQRLGFLKQRIAMLFPTARIALAHGQMDDTTLAHVMHDFDQGSVDILIASTIIENGLDLPNANTLIVTSAPSLGLSDLYQLRGRVGRRERQGHAYFLYEQDQMTPIQRQRLSALTEASRLGSGWELARRDLEIRGAGNLLGAEQSGTVNAVGLQFYLDLVHDALDSKTIASELLEPDIHLPFSALIPPSYISDIHARTRWYQRLSRATTLSELTRHIQTMTEEYGPLPSDVHTLSILHQLKILARSAHITRIETQIITPPGSSPFTRLTLTTSSVPHLIRTLSSLGSWTVRGTTLSIDMKNLTISTIESLIAALSKEE